MGQKPIHDLLLKDRKTTSPRGTHYTKPINLEMEQPIIDVSSVLNRSSADPGAQSKLLQTVK